MFKSPKEVTCSRTTKDPRRFRVRKLKSASKRSQDLMDSQTEFLLARFFCRFKYMENENLLALVAFMITCFSVRRLDTFTLIELNDMGRCEATLLLISGVATMSVIVTGSSIAVLVLLLNWTGFSLLSLGSNSYRETILEKFDMHRRKTQFIRKWMVRMVLAIALCYIFTFCINPVLWCQFRVVGIFSSGFLLVGFVSFFFLYKYVGKLYNTSGTCGCLSMKAVTNENLGSEELVSSDEDVSSQSSSPSVKKIIIAGRSKYVAKEPNHDKSNIYYKNKERRKHRRFVAKQRINDDLHRHSFVLKSKGFREAGYLNQVRDKKSWSATRSTGSSIRGSERVRKQRPRSRSKKKNQRWSGKAVRRDSSLFAPQISGSRSNSYWTTSIVNEHSTQKSSWKKSTKSSNCHSWDALKSESEHCNELKIIESKSDSLVKILQEEEKGIARGIESSGVTRKSKGKKLATRRVWNSQKLRSKKYDNRESRLRDDNTLAVPSCGDEEDGKDTSDSELYHMNPSYLNPNIPMACKENPVDGTPTLAWDENENIAWNTNKRLKRNSDPSVISSGRLTAIEHKSLENSDSGSGHSLLILSLREQDKLTDKEKPGTPDNEDVEEPEITSTSEDFAADHGDFWKKSLNCSEPANRLEEPRLSCSVVLLRSDSKQILREEQNMIQSYITEANISFNKEILEERYSWNDGRTELPNAEEASSNRTINSASSNKSTLLNSKECMILLDSPSRSNKPLKSLGRLSHSISPGAYGTTDGSSETGSELITSSLHVNSEVRFVQDSCFAHCDSVNDATEKNRSIELGLDCEKVIGDTLSRQPGMKNSEKETPGERPMLDVGAPHMFGLVRASPSSEDSLSQLPPKVMTSTLVELPRMEVSDAN